MIQSVFDLNDTVVREVMVPRTDLVYIEGTKTLRQAMSLCLRSGYSRIPVIEDNDLDDVLGMAYLKDITKRVFDNRAAESTEQVDSIMRPCLFVPDTKVADDLLKEMQAQRTHVAIVVDEYGGTAGMVTIEDILEEIVGEITDEYDTEPDQLEALSDGSYRMSHPLRRRRPGRAVRRPHRRRRRRLGGWPAGQAPRQGADPRQLGRGRRVGAARGGALGPPQPHRQGSRQPGRRRRSR